MFQPLDFSEVPRPSFKRIVLVGMPGAGKSNVGLGLSKMLGLPFFDSDEEMVKAAGGLAIHEIAEKWGKFALKDAEEKITRRIAAQEAYVFSTGEDVFLSECLRKMLCERALCILLKADLDVLYERVMRRKDRLHLLTGDIRETLRRLIGQRESYYEQAHLVVKSLSEPRVKTLNRLIKTILNYERMFSENKAHSVGI